MEILQLGGKYAVLNGEPVAVWVPDGQGDPELFLLVKAGYADLEKLVEDNRSIPKEGGDLRT